MSNKQLSIDSLNRHLFETIEMLKNNNDARAEAHEKIDVTTAKAISDLAKNVIEGYKVRVQALTLLSRTENPRTVNNLLEQEGFVSSGIKKLEE